MAVSTENTPKPLAKSPEEKAAARHDYNYAYRQEHLPEIAARKRAVYSSAKRRERYLREADAAKVTTAAWRAAHPGRAAATARARRQRKKDEAAPAPLREANHQEVEEGAAAIATEV